LVVVFTTIMAGVSTIAIITMAKEWVVPECGSRNAHE
jgi:hypothetical protein